MKPKLSIVRQFEQPKQRMPRPT